MKKWLWQGQHDVEAWVVTALVIAVVAVVDLREVVITLMKTLCAAVGCR